MERRLPKPVELGRFARKQATRISVGGWKRWVGYDYIYVGTDRYFDRNSRGICSGICSPSDYFTSKR